MMKSSLFLLNGLAATAISATTPPFIPVYYKYGGYPKVMADIHYGTPAQAAVSAVMDLGSANYWVDQKYAIVNYGCTALFCVGPCNITVHPTYDPRKSKTSTKPKEFTTIYAYGGNGKIVTTNYTVNDTLSFGENVPHIENSRVALANFTILKQAAAPKCKGSANIEYDSSILGLSRFKNPSAPTGGPSFRQDLLTRGLIQSSTMSMWFDKGEGPANQTFHGTVLFGAVPPKSKYSGELTHVKLSPPQGAYVGYYLPLPTFSLTSTKTGKSSKLKPGKSAKRCLVDSGTGNDVLPISQKEFREAGDLVMFNGYVAYNGSCDSIPKDAHISLKFPGATKGKSVTIKTPLRNYARGNSDYKGNKHKCSLSLDLSTSNDCVLGAPSSTSLFLAVDDDAGEFAIAQGGVSSGAQDGTHGLGEVHVVKRGKGLPAV